MAGDKDHMTMKKKCWKAYKNCLKGCSPQLEGRKEKKLVASYLAHKPRQRILQNREKIFLSWFVSRNFVSSLADRCGAGRKGHCLEKNGRIFHSEQLNKLHILVDYIM